MTLTTTIGANSSKSIVIQLDKKHLDQMDLTSLQLPMALHMVLKQVLAELCGDSSFRATPEDMYDFMVHGVKTTSQNPRTRTNVISSIMELSKIGLIKIDKQELQWNTKIEIDASPLFHEKGEPFVSINSRTLGTITSHYGAKSSRPLVAYLNIFSYVNWEDMKFYQEEYCLGGKSLEQDILFNPNLGNDWHISCYASLKTLCSKPYSDAQPKRWITEKTISTHLQTMETLGLIKIITVSGKANDGRRVIMKHYCLPEYARDVKLIATKKIERVIYAMNNIVDYSTEEETYNEI